MSNDKINDDMKKQLAALRGFNGAARPAASAQPVQPASSSEPASSGVALGNIFDLAKETQQNVETVTKSIIEDKEIQSFMAQTSSSDDLASFGIIQEAPEPIVKTNPLPVVETPAPIKTQMPVQAQAPASTNAAPSVSIQRTGVSSYLYLEEHRSAFLEACRELVSAYELNKQKNDNTLTEKVKLVELAINVRNANITDKMAPLGVALSSLATSIETISNPNVDKAERDYRISEAQEKAALFLQYSKEMMALFSEKLEVANGAVPLGTNVMEFIDSTYKDAKESL